MPVIGDEGQGILLVPLPGHTLGHCGVAVAVGDHWLFHCGDAFVRGMQVDPATPRSPFPGWVAPVENRVFPKTSPRVISDLLRRHPDKVIPFCSHDPHAFEQLSKQAETVPSATERIIQ